MSTTTEMTWTPSTTAPASVKQVMYLTKLIVWRGIKDIDVPDEMTEAQAHELIEQAKAVPAPRRAGPPVGFYLHEGEVYEVRDRKAGGTYAQLLRYKDGRVSWKFIPGKVTKLDGAEPLTLDQVEVQKRLMRSISTEDAS
jgi:hypothetical protein